MQNKVKLLHCECSSMVEYVLPKDETGVRFSSLAQIILRKSFLEKPMKLIIKVENSQITLVLRDGRQTLDELSWEDNSSLSKTLLASIDKIFKKNKIKIGQLKKTEIKIKNAGYTSSRIAQIVGRTLNFAAHSGR
jgi:hypothetical protein